METCFRYLWWYCLCRGRFSPHPAVGFSRVPLLSEVFLSLLRLLPFLSSLPYVAVSLLGLERRSGIDADSRALLRLVLAKLSCGPACSSPRSWLLLQSPGCSDFMLVIATLSKSVAYRNVRFRSSVECASLWPLPLLLLLRHFCVSPFPHTSIVLCICQCKYMEEQ